ncbi:MAG: hypothetical protein H7326_06730 [Bdellovibrionaceae bacterium]|nr:hypothetical protein [Pseudobdellovibrionaceae bacterium]
MILWIADLTILMTGLFLFRGAISQLGSYFQNRFLAFPDKGVGTFKMLEGTALCAVSHGSFLQNQYGAMALLNSRSYSKHYAVLLLCLGILGMWTTLFGALVLWKIEASYFIAAAVVFYFSERWFSRGRQIFKMLLGLGMLSMGSAMLIQAQPQIIALLGESDFHFLLADGRFGAQLALLLGSFIVTAFIGLESWTVFVGIAFLVSGTLSLNGAVALVIGELLAHVWVIAWRARKLNQDAKSVSISYAIAGSCGLILGFFIAGLLRTVFAWGYTFEGNELENRVWQFLAMFIVIIFSQLIPLMVWGHFAARKKLEEIQKGEYFARSWLHQGLLSKSFIAFVIANLEKRLGLLEKQTRGLSPEELKQVPATFQKQHETEIANLSQWISRSTPFDRT